MKGQCSKVVINIIVMITAAPLVVITSLTWNVVRNRLGPSYFPPKSLVFYKVGLSKLASAWRIVAVLLAEPPTLAPTTSGAVLVADVLDRPVRYLYETSTLTRDKSALVNGTF